MVLVCLCLLIMVAVVQVGSGSSGSKHVREGVWCPYDDELCNCECCWWVDESGHLFKCCRFDVNQVSVEERAEYLELVRQVSE